MKRSILRFVRRVWVRVRYEFIRPGMNLHESHRGTLYDLDQISLISYEAPFGLTWVEYNDGRLRCTYFSFREIENAIQRMNKKIARIENDRVMNWIWKSRGGMDAYRTPEHKK